MRSRTALLVVVTLASVFALVQARNAVAIPPFNFYSHSGCPAGAGNRIDPVNVMFFNYAQYDRVTNQVDYHSSFYAHSNQWPAYKPQAFQDHGVCYDPYYWGTVVQMVNAAPVGDRYHIRLHEVTGWDNSWGYTSIGDAHFDNFTACHGWEPSHRVPYGGFNSAKAVFANILRLQNGNLHGVAYGYYGNTDPRPQCNGDTPRSDGWLLAARIHPQYH